MKINASRPEKALLAAVHQAKRGGRPAAFVLAGHNGSGKSTFWYERLASSLKIPLINADRLTMSILPQPGASQHLPRWANRLRDQDERWQRVSQMGVQAFTGLVMDQGLPFAFETVFSHYIARPNGTVETKVEIIETMQRKGYFVVLLFVGLASADLSVVRVDTRRQQGGHTVPLSKLRERFPRTQRAICLAAPIADMTLMFDNSRTPELGFSLARAQVGHKALYDCRNDTNAKELANVAASWMDVVAPL